jgi:putative ABC transport system permease protein
MSKDFDARAVRINLPAAQDLLLLDKVHKLVVELDDSAATAQVAPLLRRLLPADRYEIKPWYELAEFYRKVVELYRRQFGILLFIVMVMVLAGVANSVNLSLYERTGECGTLMALGYRGRRVFALLMLETTALALVGSVTGVAVGLLLSWLISLHGIPMPPPPNMSMTYIALIRPQPWVAAMAFAVGMLATVLAGLLPAWRITRIPVSEALRQNV